MCELSSGFGGHALLKKVPSKVLLEYHHSSRPTTAHRVQDDESLQEEEGEEEWPDHLDEGDTHDMPTPTHEFQFDPSARLNAATIPNLRPPTASQQQQPQQQLSPDFDADEAPSTGDYSPFEGASFFPSQDQNDSYAVHAMRDHLQDVESSFVSPASPLPTINSVGFDDTFVFDSPSKPPKSGPSSSTKSTSPVPHPARQNEATVPKMAPLRQSTNKSPPPRREAGSNTQSGNFRPNPSALEAFSSPPALTSSRAMSRQSNVQSERLDDDNKPLLDTTAGTPTQPHREPANDSFLRASATSPPPSMSLPYRTREQSIPKISVDAVGNSPGNIMKSGTRPKYLRSRMSSHRSSDSDFAAGDVESDATIGTADLRADYALQSGGAVPAVNMSRNSSMSNIITRQISMGSMASDFREDSTGRIGLEPLEPLNEDDDIPFGSEQLKTPRGSRQSLSEPTDTVIARHVRNVQVPESLAREYKTKSGLVTPRRKTSEVNLNASASSNRTGKNLTLKEQSSTIERLSKENFDLKLKVMFLSDRLDKLSEEGIKEMISENVELKTSLAVLQRDNKVLRRRVKELERKAKDDDERPGTAKSGASSTGQTAGDYEQQAANEEELLYLRERVEEYISEIERLRQENLGKEAEKRRMAEVVRNLQTLNESRMGESLGQDDETEVWRELYSQESLRREQAEDDNQRVGDENKKLRDEIFRLKQEMAGNNTTSSGGNLTGSGLHHTTNIYNISRKPRAESPSRSKSRMSESETMTNTMSVSVTLVDELRRESEQLRHENAELRREVGAQTSMLTSRNREKERLYQEIEDLKMAQRRGGTASSTLDSILERSASRSGIHDRPMSRGSQVTRTATLDEDPEREELENKLAEMRDKLSAAKMQNQDLQQELNAYVEEYEAEVEARKEVETAALQMQEELEAIQNDLMGLQQERDELLQENTNMDQEFNNLRAEAQDEIDHLEGEMEQRDSEMVRLNQELAERSENQEALQEEMRRLSDDMIRFEDTQETQLRRIKQLEDELGQSNAELEDLEEKLVAANDKVSRLSVQQESNQSEIAFLREEQEHDKMKIGELIGQTAQLEVVIREEKGRSQDLETQIQNEREQHEIVTNQEKEEVQQVVNQLNRDLTTAKDESRKLRKNLSKQEIEAAEWKERLLELENSLREVLGDLNGTRSSFVRDISKLQYDLEKTCRELDSTRASLNEKDHFLKGRDELLETSALEARRLAEMFDKEKQLHRATKHELETYHKTQLHIHGNMSSAELRIKELEASKSRDKQRLAKLESTLKEQLNERNSLLLVLWTRLSTLCGTDWAHDNSLINGRALPSLEAVATMLPGFSKNLLAAIKTIESIVGKFQDRVKGVERELWKEYQHLDETLDKRAKKIDKLESMVRNAIATGSLGLMNHNNNNDAYRHLKVENATLRTANEVRARQVQDAAASLDPRADRNYDAGSPSPSIPRGPRERASGSLDRDRERSSRQTSRTYVGPSMTMSSTSSGRRRDVSRPALSRARTENEAMNLLSSGSGGGGGGAGTPSQGQVYNPFEYDPGPPSASTAPLLSPGGGGTTSDLGGLVVGPSGGSGGVGTSGGDNTMWISRLKDLEVKLKAEREGRLLDRSEASRRILDLEEVAREAQVREAKREKHRKLQAAALSLTKRSGSSMSVTGHGGGQGGVSKSDN
ncbi:hypothetical protein BD289DRAFT_462035 [Coniella lustricola]|uniref:Anucleate primary sterigmata protein B n=1 Tax=Coniella lustricola TaxID=2025994 RepID=A0A2T3A2J1_9PEZI|nr:hypothetical protein BD289DRAFT_462035 [Coniella lustricola]